MPLLLFLFLLINPIRVFAISPPNLASPANNSTVNSSKLTWDIPAYELYSNNPYRIQVDDNSDFSSIFRDYTTDNSYYSPTITDGMWFWRVKSKDASGTWSDWSDTWTFTMTQTIATANPPPPPENSPTPSPTSSNQSASFIISQIPTSISSNQSFTVAIDLNLPNNPNSTFYLKGAFKKSDSSNYFGLTKVGSDWVKNSSSFISQVPISTNSQGLWSGTIEVKPDPDDSGLNGSGQYLFKIARYSVSGSGPSWSNETGLNINYIDAAPSKTSSTAKTSTITQTPSPNPAVLGTSIVNPKSNFSHSSTASANEASIDGQIQADSSQSAETQSIDKPLIKSTHGVNPIIFVGLFFIAVGCSYLAFIYIKSRV